MLFVSLALTLAERETLEPSVGALSDPLPALAGESSAGRVTPASRLLAYTPPNTLNLLRCPPEGGGVQIVECRRSTQRRRRKERRALRDEAVFQPSLCETSEHAGRWTYASPLFFAPGSPQSVFVAVPARLALLALAAALMRLKTPAPAGSGSVLIAFIAFSWSLHLLAAIASDSFSGCSALAKLAGKLLRQLVPSCRFFAYPPP